MASKRSRGGSGDGSDTPFARGWRGHPSARTTRRTPIRPPSQSPLQPLTTILERNKSIPSSPRSLLLSRYGELNLHPGFYLRDATLEERAIEFVGVV
ncbi:hypothetical protein KM043_008440 [Ampulex compressa]|nr:hypothetical protein KM043_008440 [Ampulex compressa]